MLPYQVNYYGNPHSRTHAYGWESETAMETARKVKRFSLYDDDTKSWLFFPKGKIKNVTRGCLSLWAAGGWSDWSRSERDHLHERGHRVQQHGHQGHYSLTLHFCVNSSLFVIVYDWLIKAMTSQLCTRQHCSSRTFSTLSKILWALNSSIFSMASC